MPTRHIAIEQWNQRESWLHARDARAKLAALLIFLVTISTTVPGAYAAWGLYATLLAIAALASGIPPAAILWRSALILPFSATFAGITWFSGDPDRAVALLTKSWLSAVATILIAGTTPLAQLSWALEFAHIPRVLVMVIQFVYRYLFVIAAQAQQMRWASLSRRGRSRAATFRGAAGAIGVLFARSWERADAIHQAMLARGFQGHMPLLTRPGFASADYLLLAVSGAASLAIRFTV